MNDTNEVIETGALPSLNAAADEKVLGVPSSKAKSKTNVGKLFYLLAFLAGFLFIVFAILLYVKNHKSTKTETAAPAQKEKAAFLQKNESVENAGIEKIKADLMAKQEKEDAEKAALALAAEPQPNQMPVQNAPMASAASAAPLDDGKPKPPTPKQRRMSGAVLVDYLGGDKTLAQNATNNAAAGSLDGASAQAESRVQGNNNIAAQLQPTVLAGRVAGNLPNMDYLLKRGTSIPCALKTGIDTTLAGFVICKSISDVYSANGKTLLVERGADIFGEQQSSLKQGQERTFVLWTRVDNPSGVYANLDSPATDQMGFNGIAGTVDDHFFKRFGGAIMISLIKDFSQAISQSQKSSGNTGPTYNNTSSASEQLAVETLRNTINIPPTLVVNPATIVNVMVARDVSFESVYGLVK